MDAPQSFKERLITDFKNLERRHNISEVFENREVENYRRFYLETIQMINQHVLCGMDTALEEEREQEKMKKKKRTAEEYDALFI